MAIITDELKIYAATVNSDADANGGRLSANEVIDNAKNNMLPDVSQASRTTGRIQYRKFFAKVDNQDNLALRSVQLYVKTHTPGDDRIAIFTGTQRDTQADISSPDLYGCAPLKTNASATDTSFTVTLEADEILFRTGDTVMITDGTNTEVFENVTVAKTSLDVEITLDGSDELVGTIETDYGDEVDADDAYDFSAYPPTLYNMGTIEQTWTLTVSDDASGFDVTGDTLGSVDTAQPIDEDYNPYNPSSLVPYFLLQLDGWSGSLEGNEVVRFRTSPAAYPFWLKRNVPAGSAAYTGNTFAIYYDGESSNTTSSTTTTTTA